MNLKKSVLRTVHRAGASSLALALLGCSSLDPFTNDDAFRGRLGDYPTLRTPQTTAQTVEPDAELEPAEARRNAQKRPAPQIFRGRTPASQNRDNAYEGDSLVLNFETASVKEAASLILGDFLNIPYEVHPSVSGVINLKSAAPLSGEAALRAFETVLRQNKAALVLDGDLYRIVPEQLALGYASAPQIGTGRPIRPGYGVQIAPLEFVTAAEMAEILKPLAAADSVIRIDAERNLLLLAGSSRELSLWLETIRTFDIDWFAGKSVGIFPLRQVSAEKVAKELEAIFQTNANDQNAAVRFLPIERTNSVMAITRAAPLLDKVRSWTTRLDADSGAARRLRVYSMKNAKASDVAPLLQEIFNAPSENVSRQPVVAPGETPSTIDGEGVVQASTGVRPNSLRRSTNTASSGADTLRIIPDESANTLLMLATQDEYTRIESALRKLDVAPLQVLVEATIVEVTITDDLRYGVQYFLEGSLAQESAVAALSNAASQAILPTFPGFSLVLGEPSKIILDALENITEINVISSPNLMVLDNQTARLVVGDQIPVTVQNVTNGFTDGDNDPVLFNSIEFRDTGVIFEVTPRISSDGAVTLDIVQEVSTVSGTAGPTLTPTISQRRIDSSVVAQSGQTIVLGGLFADRATRGRSGLPIISRAPLLGGLFSNTNKDQTRTELVVLIQPRILRNEADATAITREFQDRVTGLQLLSDFDAPSATPTPAIAPAYPATPQPKAPANDLVLTPKVEEAPLAVLKQPPVTQSVLPVEEEALQTTPDAEPLALESVLPITQASAGAKHFVQLGAREKQSDAQTLARDLKSQERNLADAPIETRESRGVWRVLAGPYSENAAETLCNDLDRPCAVISE